MTVVTPLEFYLCVLRPQTVFSGIVATTPSSPFMTIQWQDGVTGTFSNYGNTGAPMADNTVSFGIDGSKGEIRLRSWNPNSAVDPTTGYISIAENSDIGSSIKAGDSITIKQEFRLWPIYPRPVQSGESVTHHEDYDLEWGDQGQPTVYWRPQAVCGPPSISFYENGISTGTFVGDRSYALAPGATITNYLWTAHGSNEITNANAGTVESPVYFTWNNEGQYLVSLQVTDSNNRTHTQYTWAFVIKPSDSTIAYSDIDNVTDNFSYDQGGGEVNFTVFGNADISNFPKGALVVYAARGQITDSNIGSWPYRDNVLFCGYIVDGSITQSPETNTFSFKASTINNICANTSIMSVSLTDVASPSDWVDAVDLNIDRVLSFVTHWRSTLSKICSIMPLQYEAQIFRQDLGISSILNEMDNLLKDGLAKTVVSPQGIMYFTRDYQLMTTGSERAATPYGCELDNSDWLGDITIEEKSPYSLGVAKVAMSGVLYAGNFAEVQTFFSEAPGEVPKNYGRFASADNLILTSQDDLNNRCGLFLAKQNMPYPVIRAQFINNSAFCNAPQIRHTMIITEIDNNRGLSWQPIVVARAINRVYNNRDGYFTVNVDFEPDASGPPGRTVIMPPKPPIPTIGEDPVLPTGTTASLLAAGSISLFLDQWEATVTGTSTHWAEKDFLSPSRILRAEKGKVFQSVNSGLNWAEVTPDSNPPSGSATVPEIDFIDIKFDKNDSKIILGGNFINSNGHYESYLCYSTGSSILWRWW